MNVNKWFIYTLRKLTFTLKSSFEKNLLLLLFCLHFIRKQGIQFYNSLKYYIRVVQVLLEKRESQLNQDYRYILYPFCPKNSDDTFCFTFQSDLEVAQRENVKVVLK